MTPAASPRLLVALAAALLSACVAGPGPVPPARPGLAPAAAVAPLAIRLKGRLALAGPAGRRLLAFSPWTLGDVASWTVTLRSAPDIEQTRSYDGAPTDGQDLGLEALKPDRDYELEIALLDADGDPLSDPDRSTTTLSTHPVAGAYPTEIDETFGVAFAPRAFPGLQPVAVAGDAGFASSRLRVEEREEGASDFVEILSEPLPATGGEAEVRSLKPSSSYRLIAEGLDGTGEVVATDAHEYAPDPAAADADGRLPPLTLDLGPH